MDDLTLLRERLRTQRPVDWDLLPDIPLYMDQVLSYMERQVLNPDGAGLTAAMVNNYTKSGLLPRAEGKKYSREHLSYLTAICVLKQAMSAKDMALVLGEKTRIEASVSDLYAGFCKGLDAALLHTEGEMEGYMTEESLADGALHFALLSYAAGLASRCYVGALREKNLPDPAEEKKKKEKGKEQ